VDCAFSSIAGAADVCISQGAGGPTFPRNAAPGRNRHQSLHGTGNANDLAEIGLDVGLAKGSLVVPKKNMEQFLNAAISDKETIICVLPRLVTCSGELLQFAPMQQLDGFINLNKLADDKWRIVTDKRADGKTARMKVTRTPPGGSQMTLVVTLRENEYLSCGGWMWRQRRSQGNGLIVILFIGATVY
jgi:hypothetical protein